MKCERCPIPDPLICSATRREMIDHHLCDRLDEPGFSALLSRHATAPTPEPPPESPDEIIARVEAMAKAAEDLPPDQRQGCCG